MLATSNGQNEENPNCHNFKLLRLIRECPICTRAKIMLARPLSYNGEVELKHKSYKRQFWKNGHNLSNLSNFAQGIKTSQCRSHKGA